jgi:hypothetical protein
MSNWVERETVASSMQDVRHKNRLQKVLHRLSDKPTHSIPGACQQWSDTLAAYRFLDNPRVDHRRILSGHKASTVERIGAHEVVLLVQDTTFLEYGITQSKPGFGTMKVTEHEQYLLHPTVAFTPERLNLGVLEVKLWQRPEERVAHLRSNKPIEEKESYRWLESYRVACEVQRACPETLIVNVADREGDIHEVFLEATTEPREEQAEFLIRAKCNRRIAKGDENSYLWEEMQAARPLGRLVFDLPAAPGRKARRVNLTVKAKPVTFNRARRPGGMLPSAKVWAVYVKEIRPPKGESPIEWMLLSSVQAEDLEQAKRLVDWYRCRWEIELFFRILKQGCRIEQLRLETDQRLLNGIAVYLIIAWRIHALTMASRSYPELSCERFFEPREWQTIYLMQTRKPPPKKPPGLRTMTRYLAQLGGFLARKHDGEPGTKTIWQGYQRLNDYMSAIELSRAVDYR